MSSSEGNDSPEIQEMLNRSGHPILNLVGQQLGNGQGEAGYMFQSS
jgi:hypothetical protein